MTVRHMLQQKGRTLWTIDPDATVLDAVAKMAEKDIGSLVVMDGEDLVGIITESEKCASKAKLQWESERPSDSMAVVAVLVIDLVTIALGWLIVWGCVALGRWVHRGFVFSPPPRLSVRMFGSWGKKRANASSNCAAL